MTDTTVSITQNLTEKVKYEIHNPRKESSTRVVSKVLNYLIDEMSYLDNGKLIINVDDIKSMLAEIWIPVIENELT